MIKKISLRLALAALCLIFQNTASAAVPQSKGRIVVFADKKVGDFQADKSIRDGTSESLNHLKLAQTDQKNIHACFVGSSEDIKPILNTMISNSNKDGGNEGLKLKTFATDKTESSIHVQVISDDSKDLYLDLKLGPC